MSGPPGAVPEHERPTYPTSLGTSDADSIRLLGQDLAHDLMGKVGFGELAFWLVAGRRPTSGEVHVFEAVLVALADHGFTPTAIAARLTYLSAPDSLQGALAAGLLGGGSRFLGVTEDAGRFLAEALAADEGPLPTDDDGWDAMALDVVRRARAAGRYVPGLGHPSTSSATRARPCSWRSRRPRDCAGQHLRLYEAIGRVHPQVLGRTLPLNGAGVCGAALADLGCPWRCCAAFALLARAAGLLGQLAEERRRPVAMDVTWTWTGTPPTCRQICRRRAGRTRRARRAGRAGRLDDRVRRGRWLSWRRSSRRPTTPSTTRRARLRRARRRRSRRSGSARSRRSVRRSRRPRPTSCSGRVGPLPPALARQHAAVPRGPRRAVRRQLVQRGARVRPAAHAHARRPGPVRARPARRPRRRVRPRVQQRAATRPQRDVPDHHAAAAERPAVVPVYTNIFAPPLPQPKRFVELGRTAARAGRVVASATSGSRSSAPATCPSSSAAPGSSDRTGRTPRSTPRPSNGSPTVISRAAWPR